LKKWNNKDKKHSGNYFGVFFLWKNKWEIKDETGKIKI
jgi:hypothetical protein